MGIDLLAFDYMVSQGKPANYNYCGVGELRKPVGLPDIELSPEGKPRWVTSYVPREDVADGDLSDGKLLAS